MSARRVAVVGAGWSGLAAAIALTRAGHPVALFDAAPQAGGRARGVQITLGDRDYPLDNGQHLLIGAYCETLALMRVVGIAPERAFIRQPFALRYPDGFALAAAALPAPLHLAAALLRARGLDWRSRWAMARQVQKWKAAGWRAPDGHSAAQLMHGLPAVLVERVWEPLCVAALNVRLHACDATMFLTVLRDSLGADARASDLLLPRGDLSSLFPDAALHWLQAHGADLRLRCAVDAIQPTDGRWRLDTRHGPQTADALILALPPARAAALLGSLPAPQAATALPTIDLLGAVDSAPIATVYLRYAEAVRLPHPVLALRESPSQRHHGQWVFDRGALDPRCAGILSVVISAAGEHQLLGHAELVGAVARQLTDALGLPEPQSARLIEDKRATIVPAPGLRRPPVVLPLPGLYLAGDAADSPYPSTIEGSVRSGLQAARAVDASA
jgi:squalene-associated FAD-dependent desaturase